MHEVTPTTNFAHKTHPVLQLKLVQSDPRSVSTQIGVSLFLGLF